jgi:hypothetical protein
LDCLPLFVVQVIQLELAESLELAMAMVSASVWTLHWDHCDWNMPSTTNKQGGFILVLATEIDMYMGDVNAEHFQVVGDTAILG